MRCRLTVTCLVLVLAASEAAAQGRGNAFGRTTRGGGPSASTAPEVQASVQPTPTPDGARMFGTWLDDATIYEPWNGGVTLSAGYWRTPAYREWDVPSADAALGLTKRVQIGVSVPFYHAGEPGGPVAHGIGDLYFNGKVQLRDPAKGGPGFSVSPLIEVLTAAPAVGRSRFGWALPGSVELRGSHVRVYGTAGYFSRGALFASGAVEVPVSDRVWVTGTIGRSHSIEAEEVSRVLGPGQTRTDASGTVSVAIGPVMAFGSIGRTLSQLDANSATLTLAGGLTFSYAARPAPPVRGGSR